MRNIVILNSLHFSYPLPILMRVSYNTLIVKQNTSDYYKYTQKEQDFKDYNKFIADNSLLKDCMPFWIFSNCRLRGLCTPAA